MADPGSPRPGRCTALLGCGVAALVGATHLARLTPPPADFGAALTWLAGWVLCGCCCWAVLVALVLLLAALRGPVLLGWCCPRAWRPLLLAAVGAALASGVAVPAQAQGWRAPSLGRPVDAVGRPLAQPRPSPGLVVVEPGDSLWRIVAAHHPAAGDDVLAALVAATYRTNRAVIGPDADLLRPGQELRLPDERSLR